VAYFIAVCGISAISFHISSLGIHKEFMHDSAARYWRNRAWWGSLTQEVGGNGWRSAWTRSARPPIPSAVKQELIVPEGPPEISKMEKTPMKLCRCMLAIAGIMSAWQPANSQQAATATVVPTLVNFSGKAMDADGKVISGIAGATFAIYKDQEGGAPLWLETQNVQADSKGNFTAQLGATKPAGLPLDLFTSGEARWLGVTVNGGQEQPRVLLLSVPYALKAADAQTLGGLPASAFLLAAPVMAAAANEVTPANSSAQSATPAVLRERSATRSCFSQAREPLPELA